MKQVTQIRKQLQAMTTSQLMIIKSRVERIQQARIEEKKTQDQLRIDQALRKQREIVEVILSLYETLKNKGIPMAVFLNAIEKYSFPEPGVIKVSTKKPIKTSYILPRKYRNPENINETWSGRGRQPLWFVRALEAGKTPDELLNPYERINSSIAD